MPTSIRVATAHFTKAIASLTQPNLNGLVLEALLGGTQQKSLVNRANPSTPMTIVGAPTYGDYGANVSGGGFGENGIDTGHGPDRQPHVDGDLHGAGQAQYMPVGSYISNTSILGFMVGVTGQPIQFSNSRWGAPPDIAALTVPSGSNPFFIAGVGALGQPPILYLGAGGNLTNNTGGQSGFSPRNTAATIRFGDSEVGGYGTVNYGAMFNRAMSEAEVLAAYRSLRAYYTGKLAVM